MLIETWLHWEAKGTLPLGSGGCVELWRWLKLGARVMFQVDKRAKNPTGRKRRLVWLQHRNWRVPWYEIRLESWGNLTPDWRGQVIDFFGLLQAKGMALNYLRQKCVCIRNDGYGRSVSVLWKPCPGCSVEGKSQSSNRRLEATSQFVIFRN